MWWHGCGERNYEAKTCMNHIYGNYSGQGFIRSRSDRLEIRYLQITDDKLYRTRDRSDDSWLSQ